MRRIQFNNVRSKPLSVTLTYLSLSEQEDEYILLKKKPGKQVKAKSNANCQKLAQEHICLCQRFVGPRVLQYQFQGCFRSNRIQIVMQMDERNDQSDVNPVLAIGM